MRRGMAFFADLRRSGGASRAFRWTRAEPMGFAQARGVRAGEHPPDRSVPLV